MPPALDPYAALANPATPGATLADIASGYPALRAAVAAHPNAYPGLLDWLDALGDPAVSAAVAVRRNQARPSAAPVVTPAPGGWTQHQPGAAPQSTTLAAPANPRSKTPLILGLSTGVGVLILALVAWFVVVPMFSPKNDAWWAFPDITTKPHWSQPLSDSQCDGMASADDVTDGLYNAQQNTAPGFFFWTWDHYLCVFRASDGAYLWSRDDVAYSGNYPSLSRNGTMALLTELGESGSGRELTIVHTSDGSVISRVTLPPEAAGAVELKILAYDGDTVVLQRKAEDGVDGGVFAVQASAQGQKRWSKPAHRDDDDNNWLDSADALQGKWVATLDGYVDIATGTPAPFGGDVDRYTQYEDAGAGLVRRDEHNADGESVGRAVLSTATGSVLWESPTAFDIAIWDNRVAAAHGGTLTAYDLGSRATVWANPTAAPPEDTAGFIQKTGNVILSFTYEDGEDWTMYSVVAATRASDGATVDVPGEVGRTTITPPRAANTYYTWNFDDAELIAFDTASPTFAQRWSIQSRGTVWFAGGLILDVDGEAGTIRILIPG